MLLWPKTRTHYKLKFIFNLPYLSAAVPSNLDLSYSHQSTEWLEAAAAGFAHLLFRQLNEALTMRSPPGGWLIDG